ncbi:GNAT family N-acetyltransferase [Nocardioides sp. AE5]|uniref:GNAT family N-acetyltransferase n=1 Tax=Nocardioides sp. AE5 TaxID=2962573 RepID=UPI002881094F|nr:GNAT family N-acetyltransferase [Nocardioides sp. AE5]MDT0203595.1 GNAT family N-acetyltransferase [Nocardioides sp. AE5]
MEIIDIDLADPAMRRDFFAVETEVVRHDVPGAWERSYESFEKFAMQPDGRYNRRFRFGALVDGRLAGTVEMWHPLEDNTHLADVSIAVRPQARGGGVGSALMGRVEQICAAHGRTTLVGELDVPVGQDFRTTPGGAFATGRGFESVHTEDQLVLDLPADTAALAQAAARATAGYEIVLWGDRCPDEHVAGFCAMRTQMSSDVPTGGIDVQPVAFDEERLRTGEQHRANGWTSIVAAAVRRHDRIMGGYSMLRLPHGGDLVAQDDALVMPEHRGHRLGTALKLATLDVVRREHPERRAVHTWTEPSNHAMQRTNRDFGYQPRSVLHKMQRKR